MGKRQDESWKERSARTKKPLSPSKAIMEMTSKDAWKYRTIFGSAKSRKARSRDEE